jgi:hypothetical protein
MFDPELLGNQTMLQVHHVAIADLGNAALNPSLGLLDCPWPTLSGKIRK